MGNLRKFRRRVNRHDQQHKRELAEQTYRDYFIIDPSFPFDQADSFFMCWLTPAEWKFLFALTIALEEAQVIPQDRPMQETFINAIAYLQREHGYEFKGLTYTYNNELFPKVPEALSKGNMASIQMLRIIRERTENPQAVGEDGEILSWRLAMSYIGSTEFAIEFARKNVPSFDLDILRYALHRHHENLATEQEIPEHIKAALVREEAVRKEFYELYPDIAAQVEALK